MAVAKHYVQSPCIVWTPELPRVDRKCESPRFPFDGYELQFMLLGCWNGDLKCEEWELSVKNCALTPMKMISLTSLMVKKRDNKLTQKKAIPSPRSITVYIENKCRELKFVYCGEINFDSEYNCVFQFNRIQYLHKYGITRDKVSMFFTFDLNSKLTKHVIITELSRSIAETQGKPSNRCLQGLSEDIEKLYNKPEFSNAILMCGGQRFPVNKEILGSRSKVLAEMLNNNVSQNETVELNKDLTIIEVKDIQPHILELILHYVYSGKVDNLNMETVFELYKASEMYSIPLLKKKCSSFMASYLSISNACEILLLADIFRDTELFESAIAFVVRKQAFLGSLTWRAFAEDNPAVAVKVFLKFHE